MEKKFQFGQAIKFSVVGILQNGIGYLGYLLLVSKGLDPKSSVAIVYPAAALASFWGNRKWVFSHTGDARLSILWFALAHIGGFFINVATLHYFVGRLGFPHEIVQAAAILVLSVYFFLALRFSVFPDRSKKY